MFVQPPGLNSPHFKLQVGHLLKRVKGVRHFLGPISFEHFVRSSALGRVFQIFRRL